ncbi:hypothetical protein D1643_00390 [Enterorhabdus sp. P55]|nr:hypothetical protein [Enterorhabdus sp. P55]
MVHDSDATSAQTRRPRGAEDATSAQAAQESGPGTAGRTQPTGPAAADDQQPDVPQAAAAKGEAHPAPAVGAGVPSGTKAEPPDSGTDAGVRPPAAGTDAGVRPPGSGAGASAAGGGKAGAPGEGASPHYPATAADAPGSGAPAPSGAAPAAGVLEVDPASLSPRAVAAVAAYQESVATEADAYRRMAAHVKDPGNRATLERIADEKAADADAWARYTGRPAVPRVARARRYALIARILGFTFAVKLMDKHKHAARSDARALAAQVPAIARAEADEERRGRELMGMLDEKLLSYVGAMVLGMNDAVVEITGTLAGLTLAMQNTRLIALSGLITGIAATLSMAASEYLAAKSDGRPDAKRACAYTGSAYALTVVLLLLPYLLMPDKLYLLAMAIMLAVVVLILAAFNFYTAVAQDLPFKKRFAQMCAISLGVAALSFFLGLFCKIVLGVEA